MVKLSMNEMTTYRWSFEEDVQQYKDAGIEAIAVWRQKLSDCGEDKAAELIAENGLHVSCLMWAGGFTGSDGRSYKECVRDAKYAMMSAVKLRTHNVIVYSGPRAGHTHSHARRLFRNALEELSPIACEHDISLAIKPMHDGCADEWTFLTDLEETLELITSIPCRQLKLAFDVYHLAHDAAVIEQLPQLVPQIAIVQLGDARQRPSGEPNRCRLGDGSLPWREVVQRLDQAGYDGYYDIELMGEDIEHCDYRELIRQSKAAVEELFEPC